MSMGINRDVMSNLDWFPKPVVVLIGVSYPLINLLQVNFSMWQREDQGSGLGSASSSLSGSRGAPRLCWAKNKNQLCQSLEEPFYFLSPRKRRSTRDKTAVKLAS